jgi:hypothetical protein
VFGPGIPLLGGFIGFSMMVMCLLVPQLRKFALAAFVAPLAASIVCFVGLLILADMNLAAEYGSAYIPTGREHNPTHSEMALWLGASFATLIVSAIVSWKVQQIIVHLVRPPNRSHAR